MSLFLFTPLKYPRISRKLVSFLAALFLCASWTAWAQEPLVYETRIEGALSEQSEQLVRDSLDTVALQDTPPSFQRLLSSRASNDLPVIQKVLDSLGHFKAQPEFEIFWEETPIQVVFRLQPGPAFTIEKIRIELTDPTLSSHLNLPSAEDINLKPGKHYRAAEVVAGRKNLVRQVAIQGFPFANVADTQIVADHATESVQVAFLVDSGPRATFGETEILGLETLEYVYIFEKIPWKAGQLYTPETVEKARRDLIATGLFSKVDITLSKALDAEQRLPVKIEVAERAHRTFSAGVFYRTDLGPGVKTAWEHRNILGQGERLKSDLIISQYLQSLESTFRKGEYFRPDQSLLLSSFAGREITEAYQSTGIQVAGGLERHLTENATVGLGLGYRLSKVKSETEDETNTFGLVSVPLTLALEGRENPLDPQSGYRLAGEVAPYADTLGSGSNFLKFRLSAGLYIPLWPEVLTLALRGSMGSIYGAPMGDIPMDIRFYSGGGGSIRGYGHQLAGDVDEHENPIGGRSLVETSIEMRFKVTEDVGFALFLDGGRAFEDSIPDMSDNLFWGVGAGLRYYTGIGPLRLDVAVPIDPRNDVDQAFQVYMSLGQAF